MRPTKARPRQCWNIAGALNPRPNAQPLAERAGLKVRTPNLPAAPPRGQPRQSCQRREGTVLFVRNGEKAMTAHPNNASIAQAVPTALQRPLHVVIIGGGIGGLALAQGFKKNGVSVAVYERDRTRTDRVQGYRVHINPTGSRALHECLPPDLFDVFTRTCGKPGQGIRFITEQGKVLLALEGMNATEQFHGDGVAQHRSVSRITLRQVLLSGLGDIVHFGKTFAHYEEGRDGRVIAYFEDGTTAAGDILVGADGGGSRVRRQFLPHAKRIETGIVGIAGKVFLDAASRRRIAPEFLKSLTLVSGKRGYAFFVA